MVHSFMVQGQTSEKYEALGPYIPLDAKRSFFSVMVAYVSGLRLEFGASQDRRKVA